MRIHLKSTQVLLLTDLNQAHTENAAGWGRIPAVKIPLELSCVITVPVWDEPHLGPLGAVRKYSCHAVLQRTWRQKWSRLILWLLDPFLPKLKAQNHLWKQGRVNGKSVAFSYAAKVLMGRVQKRLAVCVLLEMNT